MAKTKSAKKRDRQNAKRRACNVARKTAIKTAAKKVLVALEANDVAAAKELLRQTESMLARARGKKVVSKNTAARKVSRLAKKLAAMGSK